MLKHILCHQCNLWKIQNWLWDSYQHPIPNAQNKLRNDFPIHMCPYVHIHYCSMAVFMIDGSKWLLASLQTILNLRAQSTCRTVSQGDLAEMEIWADRDNFRVNKGNSSSCTWEGRKPCKSGLSTERKQICRKGHRYLCVQQAGEKLGKTTNGLCKVC